MFQKEVAPEIGVRRGTINKWECNRGEPPAVNVPWILEFLGYDPLPEPRTFEERLRIWRLRNGLSAHAASELLGVGTATWAAWERGAFRPRDEISRKLKEQIRMCLRQ